MKMNAALAMAQISRRDLMKLTGTYGVSSVVMGAATLSGAVTLPSLAQAV